MSLDIVIGCGRLLIWGVVLYYIVPRKIFSGEQGSPGDGIAAVSGFAVAVVVIVQVLSLLRVLDLFSFLASIGVFALGVYRVRTGRLPWRQVVRLVDRVHCRSFDLLDGALSLSVVLRGGVSRVVGRVVGGLRGVATVVHSHPEFVGLICVYLVLSLAEVGQDPRFVSLGEYTATVSIKNLAGHKLYTEGVYPLGAHSLLYPLTSLARMSHGVAIKISHILLFLLAAWGVYAAVWRNSGLRKVGALLTAALVLLLPTSLPGLGLTIEPAFQPLLLGGVLLVVGALLVGRGATLSLSALSAFVHPLAWAALLVLALCRAALHLARRGRRALRETFVGLGLFVAAALPAFALLAGVTLLQGGHRTSPLARELLPASGLDLSRAAAEGSILLVTALGAALVVFLWPAVKSRKLTAAGLAFVVLIAALLPERLGLPLVVKRTSIIPLIVPLGLALIGIATNLALSVIGRWAIVSRRGLTVGATTVVGLLTALALGFFSPTAYSRQRYEPLESFRAMERVRREVLSYRWTIVGAPRMLPHVLGSGWVLPREGFLKRYSAIHYRWDPRYPKLAVPTQHVFVFVHKRVPSDVRPALRGDPARFRHTNERLESWCQLYMMHHDDMTVWQDSPQLRVYHIHRTRDREKAIMKRIWKEKHG